MILVEIFFIAKVQNITRINWSSKDEHRFSVITYEKYLKDNILDSWSVKNIFAQKLNPIQEKEASRYHFMQDQFDIMLLKLSRQFCIYVWISNRG